MHSIPVDTKAIRLLAAHDVTYVLLPHSRPVFTVEEAAAQRGVVAEEMVKSILLRESGRGRYVMACVLGPQRLDHRAVRANLPGEWGRLSFAGNDEIAAITGYPRGAVNPLALPPDVPVIFDEAIGRCRRVNISTGDPMVGLELDAGDLIRLAGAQLAPIAEEVNIRMQRREDARKAS
jgi:prolyl-tRNA editing enzyme YbaK/EbsC (Cys-tRNA(Pro) deacylase)